MGWLYVAAIAIVAVALLCVLNFVQNACHVLTMPCRCIGWVCCSGRTEVECEGTFV